MSHDPRPRAQQDTEGRAPGVQRRGVGAQVMWVWTPEDRRAHERLHGTLLECRLREATAQAKFMRRLIREDITEIHRFPDSPSNARRRCEIAGYWQQRRQHQANARACRNLLETLKATTCMYDTLMRAAE